VKILFGICLVCLPLRRLQVTSPFGYRTDPITGKYTFHGGVDLRASADTVYAILDGRVIIAGYEHRSGIFIRLSHRLFYSGYCHLSQVFVAKGDSVKAGQPIAITGLTGSVTGEHLHFSIYSRQGYLNPLEFLYKLLTHQEHE
jgi:murein DD-endopeptidase MepM/ murein hydrolase activator NlpD